MTNTLSRRSLALASLGALPWPALAQGEPMAMGGVVGEMAPGNGPMAMEVTRSMTPELLRPTDPVRGFPGEVRAWLDRPDGRYAVGQLAFIGAEASINAHIQILGISADARPVWLFPPDSLTGSGSVPDTAVPLPARTPLMLPRPAIDRFVLRIREPVGPAIAFVIASTRPFSRAERDALALSMAGATDVAASHSGLLRGLEQLAERSQDIMLRHFAVPYVTRPGPAPQVRIRDIWQWLAENADAAKLAIDLGRSVFQAGRRMPLVMRFGVPGQLTVLALGQGGLVDVAYPNLRQRGPVAAGQELTVAPESGPLQLRVRGPVSGRPEEERLVAILQPIGAPPLVSWPDDYISATLSFMPGSPEFTALESALRQPDPNRVVRIVRYTVTPAQ